MSSSSGGWLTRAPQVYAGDKPKTLKHMSYMSKTCQRGRRRPSCDMLKMSANTCFSQFCQKSHVGAPRVYEPPHVEALLLLPV